MPCRWLFSLGYCGSRFRFVVVSASVAIETILLQTTFDNREEVSVHFFWLGLCDAWSGTKFSLLRPRHIIAIFIHHIWHVVMVVKSVYKWTLLNIGTSINPYQKGILRKYIWAVYTMLYNKNPLEYLQFLALFHADSACG